jgi:hypothetical protein
MTPNLPVFYRRDIIAMPNLAKFVIRTARTADVELSPSSVVVRIFCWIGMVWTLNGLLLSSSPFLVTAYSHNNKQAFDSEVPLHLGPYHIMFQQLVDVDKNSSPSNSNQNNNNNNNKIIAFGSIWKVFVANQDLN